MTQGGSDPPLLTPDQPDELRGPHSLVRVAGAETAVALRRGLPRGQPQGGARAAAVSPRQALGAPRVAEAEAALLRDEPADRRHSRAAAGRRNPAEAPHLLAVRGGHDVHLL